MVATIIWFIVILSVIVIAHELGHFMLARVNGIRVVEFAVGMGPTILHFTKGETKYSLKLLPIGGACMFDGEDGVDAKEGVRDEHSFLNAKVWARISCVFAGPMFNFIIAFIFALIIVGFCGTDLPTVQGLTEGRPAAESGLMVGDTIKKINGESIHLWRDISLISFLSEGEDLNIVYEREGQEYQCSFKPAYSETEKRYYIGIEGGGQYTDCKGLQLVQYSFYELQFQFKNTLKSLKQLILGKLSPDNVSGPVGIAQVVGENYETAKEYGLSSVILTMMNIAMLLSVNLGVINLLPLPALDGGRLVFLIIEVFRGKPIPPEKEGMVHLAGMIAFFILMILVLYNDIIRLLGK